MVLLLRLVLLAIPIALGPQLAPLLSPTEDAWHAVGRLFLAARGFTLLAAPLGFGLPAASNAALQVVATLVAMWCVRGPCACCYLNQPSAQASLARWAGSSCHVVAC